jgi:hypothetical protein
MPSSVHNVLVELLEAHPDVLEYLLTLHGSEAPGPLVPAPETAARTITMERRVDRVFVKGPPDAPESFVLVEVQLDPDDDKRFDWALYLELWRSRHRCEGALIVLTTSARVRRWIQDVIMLPTGLHGTERRLSPTVLALDEIAPELLFRRDKPFVAPVAVAAHVGRPDAERIAAAAVDLTVEALPKPLAAEQLDAILGMVDRALRERLERRVMEHHPYHSELFRGIYEKGAAEGEAKGEARGEARGEAKGKAESIVAVLVGRGLPVSRSVRRQILTCTDLKTLDVWLSRALRAKSAAAVVAAAPAAEPAAKRAAAKTAKRPAAKRAAFASSPRRSRAG